MSKSNKAQAIRRATQLLDEVESLKKQSERSQGVMDRILRQLKEEFGCNSLSQAECHLHNSQEVLKTKEEELESLVEDFDQKYRDRLEAV